MNVINELEGLLTKYMLIYKKCEDNFEANGSKADNVLTGIGKTINLVVEDIGKIILQSK